MIKDVVREAEEGEIYKAKVVKVEEFGCFVQVWPGCEGLVHISELAKERVAKVEDIVKVGDEIIVKCIGTDKKGRLNFSRKKVLLDMSKKEETPNEKTLKEESSKEETIKEETSK